MTELKITHHNIRGLNHKLTELTLYINKHKPDIVTLNETGKIQKNTHIPHYKISQPSPNTGRGVAIICRQDINIDIEQLLTITTTSPTTNLHHAILINTPSQSLQIATIYCPRKNPSHEIINTICTCHNNTIIMGDFNCRHENFGDDTADKHGKLLIQYTEDNNFSKLNDNEPTYINDHTKWEDVKDLNFAPPMMMKSFKDFWVDEDLGSDHRTINATFSSQPLTYNKRNDETTPRPHVNHRNHRQLHFHTNCNHTKHNNDKSKINRNKTTPSRNRHNYTRNKLQKKSNCENYGKGREYNIDRIQ